MSQILEDQSNGQSPLDIGTMPDLPDDEKFRLGWEKVKDNPAVFKAMRRLVKLGKGNGLEEKDIIPDRVVDQDCEFEGLLTVTVSAKVNWDKNKKRPKNFKPEEIGSVEELKRILANPTDEKVNGRSVMDAAFEYAEKLPNKGFGIDGQEAKLGESGRAFMVEDVCDGCGGHGQVNCKKCGGAGHITCKSCGGAGDIVCPSCHGQRSIRQADGTMAPCTKCNQGGYSMGKIRCSSCNGNPKLPCDGCRGHRRVSCAKCDGKGHAPRYGQFEFSVKTEFGMRRDNIPKVVNQILSKMPAQRLIKAGHAKLEDISQETTNNGQPLVRYKISIPCSWVRVKIGLRMIDFSVVGYKGKIIGLQGFLDKQILPAMKQVQKVLQKGGDIMTALNRVEEARALQDVMAARLMRPSWPVDKVIRAVYPIGFSPKMRGYLAKLMNMSMKRLTQKATQKGLFASAAASLVIGAGWFLSGLRPAGNLAISVPIDITLASLLVFGGIISTKMMAKKALVQAVGRENIPMPDLGSEGQLQMAVTALLFAAPGVLSMFV